MQKDITIQKILFVLLRHVKLIILITVLATLVTYGYSKFFIKPIYSTSSLILVQNFDNSSSTEPTTSNASSNNRVYGSDLSSSATLANTCSVLFQNSPEMIQIMDGCSLSITSENDTNFLRITVTSTDPQKAADVANKVAEKAPSVYLEFFQYGKVGTVRSAAVPSAPSAPDVNKNTMFGFAAGLVISILAALFLDTIDTTIKPDDDLYKIYGIPVFAEIVDFESEA